MANRFKLVIACALGVFAATANAGYAQLAPPPGWTPGSYATAANDRIFGRIIFQPNALTTNVGGQAVRMPAAYRLASNAGRFAARAVFVNPALAVGVGVAAWLVVAGLQWDSGQQKWVQADTSYPVSDGYIYSGSVGSNVFTGPSYDAVCSSIVTFLKTGTEADWKTWWYEIRWGYVCSVTRNDGPHSNGQVNDFPISRSSSSCPSGWYVTPAGCTQTPQPKTVTQQEFEDALAPKPMPQTVPQELPYPTPLPIERPSPYINPEPGADPANQPKFVPTGDPVPNPNYDPSKALSPDNQPWIQPGVRIQPSPTESQPWRVDMQPVQRPKPTKEPNPVPENEPGLDEKDISKHEKDKSLCENYPDIVACKTLGDLPEVVPVPNSDKEMTIHPDNGWGEGSGACPAPKTVDIHGFTLSMPFDLLCDFANGIRPVVIGLAWLAAAFTFMGLGRRA